MDCLHESRLQGIFLVPPVIFDVWHLGQFPSSATVTSFMVACGSYSVGPYPLPVNGFRGSTDFPLYTGIKADSDPKGATAVGGGGILLLFCWPRLCYSRLSGVSSGLAQKGSPPVFSLCQPEVRLGVRPGLLELGHQQARFVLMHFRWSEEKAQAAFFGHGKEQLLPTWPWQEWPCCGKRQAVEPQQAVELSQAVDLNSLLWPDAPRLDGGTHGAAPSD
jgi:hypothetical protein